MDITLYNHSYWESMEVSINGGTPSSHPFVNGLFSMKQKPTSELGDPPFMESTISIDMVLSWINDGYNDS